MQGRARIDKKFGVLCCYIDDRLSGRLTLLLVDGVELGVGITYACPGMLLCISLCDTCIRGLRSELKNCHEFSALRAVHFFSKSTISDIT